MKYRSVLFVPGHEEKKIKKAYTLDADLVVIDLESTVPDEEKRGQLISTLYDVLLEKAETAKDLGARTGSADFDFKGEVLLQCDRRLPFSVIREVMFTSGQAQFGNFRFIVIQGG